MAPMAPDSLVHRYVDIPCPSGKHTSSLVTFCNRTVVAMFCIPCEHAWTESKRHPQLAALDCDPR
jgi:hypothetical protein